MSSRYDISGITESIFSKHSDFLQSSLPSRAGVGSSGEQLQFGDSKQPSSFITGLPAAGAAGAASIIRSLPIISRLLPAIEPKQEQIQSLLTQQKEATSYKQWYDICLQLDSLLNNDAWKLDPKSDLFDYEFVKQSLETLREARIQKDYKLLLYLVRTTWIRNIGNMGNVNLYRHSYVGTKKIIEDFIAECELSLDYLVNDEGVELDDRYLLGMLIQTRKNIGRTALVLLGGSTFGIFHIGVLATLLESNLLPRIVSGSSSGSIMASILCCCTFEETIELLSTVTEKKFLIFGDDSDLEQHNKEQQDLDSENIPDGEKKKKLNNPGLRRPLKQLAHLLKYGTLFDISGLKATMLGFVGDLTFREAYNRTGKILNITVSPASIHEQTRLLNYLTAPNCLIWSAVCASCSVPGIFPSTSIYEKNTRTGEIQEWNNDSSVKYVDGSVDNDLPITRLLEMFNVDHIIACQVNPHVVPFLKMSVTCVGGEIENEVSSRLKSFLTNIYDFMSSEVIHYLEVLHEAGIGLNLSTKFISILSQQYSGDITILPDFNIKDFTKIFDNPTPAFLLECIVRGARAAWPKITVIKNHCGVEFALDKAITKLRGRIITKSGLKRMVSNSNGNTNNNGKQSINGVMLGNGLAAENNLYNLVSSPILNVDSQSPSPVPEEGKDQFGEDSNQKHNNGNREINQRTSAPKFKRHNTINYSARGENLVEKNELKENQPKKEKRKSVSAYSNFMVQESNDIRESLKNMMNNTNNLLINPNFPNVNTKRGKSTTSLLQLSNSYDKNNESVGVRFNNKAQDSVQQPSESQTTPSPPNSRAHNRSKSFYSPDMEEQHGSGFHNDNYILNDLDLDLDAYFPTKHEHDEYEPFTGSDAVQRPSGTLGEDSDGTSSGNKNDIRPDVKKVRKARSSGNFFAIDSFADNYDTSRQLKYDSERIPYYKGNPYLDSPNSSSVNAPSTPSQFSQSPTATANSSSVFNVNNVTKANLPSKRASASNSLRSSYIGLNRLKDRSSNNSNSNLNELTMGSNGDGTYQKKLMSLTSPDIRRTYRGSTRIGLSRQNSEEISVLMSKLAKEQQHREAGLGLSKSLEEEEEGEGKEEGEREETDNDEEATVKGLDDEDEVEEEKNGDTEESATAET